MVLFADTNILLDLKKIHLLKAFFSIKNHICIEESIFYDELLEPQGIQEELLKNGLICISMSDSEFLLAREVYDENPKLSFYDCVAYAVAKLRGWELMTGDKRLRKYAEQHNVIVHGLLWIIRECEKEEIDKLILLRALHIVINDPKIRVPNQSVIAMCIGVFFRQCRGERKQIDYYVSFHTCV